jgi:hypothetical protein
MTSASGTSFNCAPKQSLMRCAFAGHSNRGARRPRLGKPHGCQPASYSARAGGDEGEPQGVRMRYSQKFSIIHMFALSFQS